MRLVTRVISGRDRPPFGDRELRHDIGGHQRSWADAINCPGVQDYDGLVRPKDFPAVVAGCAKRLGAKANAFGSAAVAGDR